MVPVTRTGLLPGTSASSDGDGVTRATEPPLVRPGRTEGPVAAIRKQCHTKNRHRNLQGGKIPAALVIHELLGVPSLSTP